MRDDLARIQLDVVSPAALTVLAALRDDLAALPAAAPGAQARRLSDGPDPRFVLLGGQGGWIGSASVDDRAAPFLEGRGIAVPLSPAAEASACPLTMRLRPKRHARRRPADGKGQRIRPSDALTVLVVAVVTLTGAPKIDWSC